MNFKTWISKYKTTNSAIGDLAKRIAKDKNFPKDDDLQNLIKYLTKQNIPNAGIDVFKYLYEEYLKVSFQ